MQTIIDLIEESARKYPEQAALRHKAGCVWSETSYRSLMEGSDQVAAGLTGHGFAAGDHAALLAPSSPRWVTAFLGVLKAGGVVIPIDKELKSKELRHILTDCGAKVLFTDHASFVAVQEMADELPSLQLTVALDPPPSTGRRFLRQGLLIPFELLRGQVHPGRPGAEPDQTAVILYTSGTTGRSKGAMLSHANIVSNIQGTTRHLQLDKSIHTLSFLPINHVFELVCGVLLPLHLGGKVSFCESLKKLGDNLAEVKPTFLLGVPAVYRMLHDRIMKNIGASRLSRLLFSFSPTRPLVAARIRKRFGAGVIFISGGAALDPAVAQGFGKLGLTLYQGYGITETAPVISAEGPGRQRLGTVGRVLAELEVTIDRPNEELVGEVLVKGPSVMQGYYCNPLATADALRNGWYRTGDLGRLDSEGFLTICGRVKNLIVTPNGKNVYPEEVENELLKSPLIAEVMVFGRLVAPATEEVCAVIYPDREALDGCLGGQSELPSALSRVESLLRAEVDAACRGLAAYKRVKRFTIRGEEFPKTTTRKIKRFDLALSLAEPAGPAAAPGSDATAAGAERLQQGWADAVQTADL